VKYRIAHVTRFDYQEQVSLCHNLAHLKLRSQPGQNTLSSQLRVEPTPAVVREHRDFFANQVSYFCIQQAHRQLTVTALSEVSVEPRPLADEAAATPWEEVRKALRSGPGQGETEARIFTMDSPLIKGSEALCEYAAVSFPAGCPLVGAVRDLMGRIYADFTYDPHFTDVATPLEDVLKHRRGVCQDFAQLAIACIRSQGLSARYVSGYLETLPPPGKSKLRGADASHAWFSIYLPGEGWVDFDPTNNQIPADQHITAAVGRDFGDVTPIKGVLYGGGEHTLDVAVDVERVSE
jgi:transglutaminase-like putative cysteine protease